MNSSATLQKANTPQRHSDRRLTLEEILNGLVADRLVVREEAERLLELRRHFRSETHHPLVLVADQKWKDPRNPKKLLHLEVLTEWLAEKVGMPYLHIDPFKIDFAAVKIVMSYG
jgi:general secretion pathway protein E